MPPRSSPLNLAAIETAEARPMLRTVDPSAWEGLTPPEREWIMPDWIPLRQATYLTGRGSAGKSLAVQQLCACVALGLPFLGIETRKCNAMYVTCEDDATELHRRQNAICAALGCSPSALKGRLHLVSLAGELNNEIATFNPEGRMSLTDRFHEIENTAHHHDIGLIALDNVAHQFAGNENIRNQVAAFCNLLNRLAASIEGAVVFIGHPNKAGANFSGSTAWENQVRSRLFLDMPGADDISADPDKRTLSRSKANYARNGAHIDFRWHHGAFVLDSDLPEQELDELANIAQATGDNAIFLTCLAERNRQGRPVSERYSRAYAPTVFAQMPEARGIGKERLEAAMDRLFRTSQIERAVLGRDKVKARDVEGLREVAASTPKPSPKPIPERFPELSPNLSPHTPQTTPHTHPLPTGEEGGPFQRGPPSLPEENSPPEKEHHHVKICTTSHPERGQPCRCHCRGVPRQPDCE